MAQIDAVGEPVTWNFRLKRKADTGGRLRFFGSTVVYMDACYLLVFPQLLSSTKEPGLSIVVPTHNRHMNNHLFDRISHSYIKKNNYSLIIDIETVNDMQ